MGDGTLAAYERFLVEDVILTLGNLRASLAWLMDPEGDRPPVALRAGLERAMRQIDQMEARARSLTRAGAIRPALPDPSPVAYADGSGIGLEHVLRDALAADGSALPAPVFRTRRAADG